MILIVVAGLGVAGLVSIHRRAAAGWRERPTVHIVATAASATRPDFAALVLFVFIKCVHKLFLVHQFSPCAMFLGYRISKFVADPSPFPR